MPERDIQRAARLEQLAAAEDRIAAPRLAVIAAGTVLYPIQPVLGVPWLAWAILALSWIYGLLVYFGRPHRRYPLMLSASFTVGTDTAMALLWLYATGSYASPFYPILYLAVIAVAFRHPPRATWIAAAVYAGGYLALLALAGDLRGNEPVVAVRLAYLGLIALAGQVIAGEVYAQAAARAEVAERLRDEEALREELRRSEAKLAEAQQIAHIGSWEWDVAADRIEWSDELYRLFGVSKGEFVPAFAGFLERIHPEDRQDVRQAIEQALARHEPFAVEHRVSLGGPVRWLHGRGRTVVDDQGRPVRLAGTAQDVTERREAEEARRKAEEARVRLSEEQGARREAEQARARAALLAEGSARLAASLDAEGSLDGLASQMVPVLADQCTVELAGRASPPAERAIASAKTAVWTELPDEPPFRELRARGVRSLLAVPILARNEALGAFLLGRADPGRRFGPEDVELAEELGRRAGAALDNARLYRLAREAIAARDEFLSIASHELRTPLTPLQLHIDGLRRVAARDGLDGRLATRLATAARQVRRLTHLVDGLLDVSRITAGRLELEREPIDLAEVARDVVERYADEARAEGSELRLTASPVTGHWDRLRVEQIVTNLLSNAVKYGAGHPIEVEVGAGERGARLLVRDHGIGIAGPDLERIFGRFERAASARSYGGLGLGLYITRQIVEAHGGSIRAESRAGEGATFVVELPSGAPAAAERDLAPAAP